MSSFSAALATAQSLESSADALLNPSDKESPSSAADASPTIPRAVDQYSRAHIAYIHASELSTTPEDSSSALYHAARCQLVMSTLCDLDDVLGRMRCLELAVPGFRAALKGHPSGDKWGVAMYNLAQGLVARADLCVEMAEEGVYEGEEEGEGGLDAAKSKSDADLAEACTLFSRVLVVQRDEMAAKTEAEAGDGHRTVTPAVLVETLLGHSEALSSRAYLAAAPAAYEAFYSDAIAKIEHGIVLCPDRKAELLCEWASVLEARAERRIDVLDVVTATLDDVRRMQRADYGEVLAKLDEAIAADAGNADAWCDKGDVWANIADACVVAISLAMDRDDEGGDKSEGEGETGDATTRVVDTTTLEAEVWNAYQEAISCFRHAAEIEPHSTGLVQKLGELNFTCARLDVPKVCDDRPVFLREAERLFRHGVDLDPADEELVARLAQSLFVHQEDPAVDRSEVMDEVVGLIKRYRELGGKLEDMMQAPNVFEDEFIAAIAELFPDESGY